MIYLPLKTVIEKYLRPHGLPDELVREIACPRYQGPGETNPFFEKSIVEGFVQERRPAPAAVRSYLNEEDKTVIAANGIEIGERIANALEQVVQVVAPREAAVPVPGVQMLTPTEAARQMKLHVQTVREWCREGKLGVRAGRNWLISPDEVKQYLRGQLLIKGKVAG